MKSSACQLAVFGGTPLFPKPLHVGQPVLMNREAILEDFDKVICSGQLTNNGPRLREFEAAVAQICRVKHVVATCNATIALQIAARALGLTGEVILPAFTFVATAHAMEWIGLVPVFADVDPQTHTLDPKSVAAAVTSKTSAVLPVHLWGNVCQTDALRQICDKNGLRLLFDSSHAFGCAHHGVSVGNFGDAEIFSFHATKFVHAFEGGAIVTNDDHLAERCRRLRAFGICGLAEISDIGTNGKMQELSAVAGLHSIATMPQRVAANMTNRLAWLQQCRSISGLELLSTPAGDTSNGQYLVLSVDESRFGLTRDQIVSILRAEGVFARSYFSPGCHQAEPYRSAPQQHCRVALSVTERLASTVFQVPTGLAASLAATNRVGRFLKMLHQNAVETRRLWTTLGGQQAFHASDPARPDHAPVQRIGLREAG